MKESSPADERRLCCGWKHLKWRHYSIKRRLFNVRRRLFSAKRRLFKTLHRRANVLSPNSNHPYTHIHPDFHPWPTPESRYSKVRSLVLQNALTCTDYFAHHIPWCNVLANSLNTGRPGSFKLAITEALSNPLKTKYARNAYIPCLRPRGYRYIFWFHAHIVYHKSTANSQTSQRESGAETENHIL